MNNQDYYNKEYVPQVNKIGKITGYLGVLLSFTPALVLAVVYGILPKPAALLTAFISGASAFGVLWFVEPISYFPVVGAAGTYMAFLSGNISNMRIPCASMAQMAAGIANDLFTKPQVLAKITKEFKEQNKESYTPMYEE